MRVVVPKNHKLKTWMRQKKMRTRWGTRARYMFFGPWPSLTRKLWSCSKIQPSYRAPTLHLFTVISKHDETLQSPKFHVLLNAWTIDVNDLRDIFKPPYCFPAVKQELISPRRSRNMHWFDWARCQKAIFVTFFTKKRGAGSLQLSIKNEHF